MAMFEKRTFRENLVCPCGDYRWEKYYWRRLPSLVPQYESDYRYKAIDPDGKERHLLEEGDVRIETVKEEIKFINGLKQGVLRQ